MTPGVLTFALYRLPGLDGPGHQLHASNVTSLMQLDRRNSDDSPAYSVLSTWMPHAGNTLTAYRLHVHPFPSQVPGWFGMRVSLEIDSLVMGDGNWRVPLSVFIGEPTDFATGIARFPGHHERPSQVGAQPSEPPLWLLGCRRSE